MEMNKYSILRWFIIAICALPLMSAGCEKGDEETGYGDNPLSNYFDVRITNCERVGSRLLIEFDLTNRSGKTLSNMNISQERAYFDTGDASWNDILRVEGSMTTSSYITVSFEKGETKKMQHILRNFDLSGSVRTVNFVLKAEPRELGTLTDNTLSAKATVSSDTRVTSRGIQTCDKKLSFSVVSCKNINGDLALVFSMTNNTGTTLRDVKLNSAVDYNRGTTDTGISFWNTTLTAQGSNATAWSLDFNVGETKTLQLNKKDFDLSGTSRNVSYDMSISCSNYGFVDEAIHFITIPIQ